MLDRFKRLTKLIPTFASMLCDFRKQRRFIRQVLENDIREAAISNDGTLDNKDFKKIRHYYGFGVPAIVGENFCTLRGIKMLPAERMASTYQGALTGLYDDFFDKSNLSREQIIKMMHEPGSYRVKTSLEKLFINFLLKVHENTPDLNLLNTAFDNVFEAQTGSLSQQDKAMSTDELIDVTIKKGGYSLLFYRSVFEHPMSNDERAAIYEIGGLMQLANDIFDVYEDSRQDIDTVITCSKHIQFVREIYEKQFQQAVKAVKRLDYPKNQVRRFLFKLSLGISRCHVCLDQLESVERSHGGVFEPGQLTRTELVCDMEKWRNKFRSASYFIKTDI